MAKQVKTSKKNTNKVVRKHRHWFLNLIKWVFAVGFAAAIVLSLLTVISVGRINPANIYENIEVSSVVYDIKGEQIDKLHYYEDRRVVSIEQMPDNLKNAFIAIEDKTFYQHHGFNFKRMI